MIKDCKDQLSRLMGSSVSTSKLAARASAIVGRYWPELTGKQRIQLNNGSMLNTPNLKSLSPPAG
jgi:hypothetical protein